MLSKETGKPPVMLMLQLLKRNIINKLKTRRTMLELLDGFKNLEVSFTTHQLLRNTVATVSLKQRKKKRKLKEVKLSHSLHLNLTNKRKNP